MGYLVFARKFRPQTFDEVVGQEPITTTLKNAISKDRIAQSFLFTGSRGVGKTSTARIFAKALNCEKGPAPTPCNKCNICKEITQGSSLDILEIDGASNRGIDEIRNLREGVKFKPASGRYKIYIIDEVHMLTGEAFNALLKTLEEPPEHVKFIFATTEVHKVPLTILSRCQRFNFRRIPTEVIAKKLKEVAKKEKIEVKDKALFMLAKHSEGSLRDGESLLDQLASFGEGEVTEKDIAFSLGLTGDDTYVPLLKALQAHDGKIALETVSEVSEEGKDLIQFSRGLIEWFRDLLVSNVTAVGAGSKPTPTLIEGTADRLKELQTLRSAFSREELLFSITLLQQLVRDVRWADTPRFLIETCLLKIANRSSLRAIEDVVKELRKKKENLTGQILGEAASAIQHAEAVKPFRTKATTRNSEPKPKADGQYAEVTLTEVGRVWPELLERVKGKKMSCGTFLSEAEPVDVMDGIVVFGLPGEFKFHKETLEQKDNRNLVQSQLVALLDRNVGVSFVVTEPMNQVSVKKKEPEPVNSHDHGIITSALDVFDGSHIIRRE